MASRKRSHQTEHEAKVSNLAQPGGSAPDNVVSKPGERVRRKLRSRRGRKSIKKIQVEASKLLGSAEDNSEPDRDPGPGVTRSKRVRRGNTLKDARSEAEAGSKEYSAVGMANDYLGAATSSWTGASGQGQAGPLASESAAKLWRASPALPAIEPICSAGRCNRTCSSTGTVSSPGEGPGEATANAGVMPSLMPSPFARPVPQPAAQEPKINDNEMLQDALEDIVNGEVDEEMLPAPEISAEEHAAKQRLAAVQSEAEEELARLSALRQEAARIDANNAAARQEKDLLSGQLASLRKETEEARRSRDAAKIAEASATKDAQEAVQRMWKLNTQIQQGHTEVKRLREEALAAQADMERSRAACAQQRKDLEAQQATIEAQRAAMAAEAEATKADLAKMASRESAAQEVLAAIRKGMDALRKGEDAWNMREAAQETRAQDLDEQEARLDEQMANLDKLTGDLQQRTAAWEESKAAQEAELSSWQATLQEKEARHAEAAKKAQECSEGLKKLAADLHKSEKKVRKERVAHAKQEEALEGRVAQLEELLAAARRSHWPPGLSTMGRQERERRLLARMVELEKLLQDGRRSRDCLSAEHERRTLALQARVAELEGLLAMAKSNSGSSSQSFMAVADNKVSQVPSGPKAPSNSNALPATPIHIHACSASQTMAPCATKSLSEEDDELSDDEDLPSGIVGAPHIKADRARARGRKEPKPEQKGLKCSLFEDTEVKSEEGAWSKTARVKEPAASGHAAATVLNVWRELPVLAQA